jgi:hypothetical protein
MTKTSIILHGICIDLRYDVMLDDNVSWHLDKDADEMTKEYKLLEFLLRQYCDFKIRCLLYDEHRANVYEKDQKAAALAEDIPF